MEVQDGKSTFEVKNIKIKNKFFANQEHMLHFEIHFIFALFFRLFADS